MYEGYAGCSGYNQFAIQSERDLAGDGLSPATLDPGKFRLTCPKPNTTYYVQVQDAAFFSTSPSTCYEGVYEPTIKTPVTGTTQPVNDEPCGAIFLGTVPNGGQLAPATVFDNFCATPTTGFIADQTQPLERDVWFSFIAPTSGSVLITAQSGVTTVPDYDIDLQIAIWDPIMGDGTASRCADPRYLWSPNISRDHTILDYGDVPIVLPSLIPPRFYYDILDTKNNVLNEGNSLIATCLKPGKMYYAQVDGGDYLLCDLFAGGNCIQGNFKIQIKDAGLYDMASMQTAPQGNDEPCGAKLLTPTAAAAPLSWMNGSNLCATAINDPVPSKWQSSDNTVWYKFVAPPEGKVRVRAEGINQLIRRNKIDPNNTGAGTGLTTSDADYHEDINLQLAVYEMGPDCRVKSTLSEIYATYDGILTENNFGNDDDYVSVGTDGFDEYGVIRCLVPGRTYYIMVDGENDPTLGLPLFEANIEDVVGDFRISVQRFNTTLASTNDNICDAYEITGTSGMALNAAITRGPFNNECASIEPGFEGPGKVADEMEGTLFNLDAKKTLWYKFKAPASGKVKIEAINTDNDPIDLGVALYDLPNENCANAVSAYKIDDDYDPAASPPAVDALNLRNEEITITCLEPDRYYYLQVDGANNPVMCLLSGGDCETGEYNIKITHLPADPTVDRVGQGNDDFCDAIDFGALNPGNNKFRNDDNNRCSTTEINEPNTNGWDFSVFDDQERTVWYRFKTGLALGPLAPGKITITVNDPSNDPCFDLDIDLYEYQGNFATAACNSQEVYNSQFSNLFRVGEGDPVGLIPLTDDNRSERIIIDCPKPNTTYFLRVNGTTTCPLFGDDQGSFDVRVEMDGVSILARENDDICGATSAPGDFGTVTSGASLQKLNQNNFCATQELGEPNTTQSAVQNEPEYDETMWYRFRTSSTPGNIKVRLEAANPLGIATVPSLTVYKESTFNYAPCTMGFSGLIEVGSDLGSATVLGGITDNDAEVELPCPTSDTDYFIQVDGADLSLFGFTIPGYADNFTYNLYVTDNGSGTAQPVNDSLKNALPVDNVAPINGILTAGGSLTINGRNNCAKAEDNEPRFSDIVSATVNGSNTTDHDNQLEDETVWYYFTTPAKPGIINVKVEDDPAQPGSFSPNFAIFYNNGTNPTYRITGAPSAQLIQEGTESTAGVGITTNKDYACLLPNTKYYIQIDGNDLVPTRTDQSAFIVTVTDDGSGNPGPSNDLICNASTVTLVQDNSVVVNGTNLCSWEEVDEPNTSGNSGGTGDDVTSNDYDETVWYKFQPSWEGRVRIQLSSAAGHNFILYKSSFASYNCTTPTWNALTRMSSSLGSTDETFGCLDNGVWYFLQIDGTDGIGNDVGPFDLTITHSSETIQTNDMFCSANNFGTFTTSGTFTAANQSNICATQELNEPNVNGDYYNINSIGYDKTLWYRFTTSSIRGDYNISVTNNSPYADRIFAGMTLYELSGTACSGVNPNWGNLIQAEQDIIPLSGGLLDGDNAMSFDCWELKTGTTYYLQVDGIDVNEVGTDFNVAVQYTQEAGPANDNVCAPTTITVGTTVTDNNNCATTQNGELNISPSPQSSYDAGYDETMWYRFQAPAEGFVRIVGTSLASDPINLNMALYEIKSGTGIGCPGSIPQWSNLSLEGTADNLVSNNFDFQDQCLKPGKWYLIQIDGNDVLGSDNGDYTIQVINQHVALSVPSAPVNDEPCGAIDITNTVQENPCPNGNPYYQSTYSIFDTSPEDVDRATSSALGQSCGSRQNCSDYWYKFTVPMDSDGGIKIQGEDDWGAGGTANSTQVVAAYRVIGNPCSGGTLQLIKCDYGGTGRDSEFDFGASPGEQIYIQVFDSDEPAAPSNPQFGLCVSTRCPPKSTCTLVNTIEYGVAQCWNLDEDGNNINDNNPVYDDCLPGDNLSANYFVFNTSCGPTANGYPDTVTVVFSAIDIASNTAMAIFEDNTPCDGNAQSVLVNCVPFGGCTGCSPSSNFIQTFLLDECKSYVIQILGEDDDEEGSAGQIYIFQSNLEPPILPLELLTFTGYNDGKSNVLEWTTASETNTDRFEVEKSTDNVNFEFLGSVRAAGNSSSPKSYGLVDHNPAMGVTYYRLKMMDADGSYQYSKVIAINTFENTASTTGIVNVYPNPTSGKLNVVFAVNEEEVKFKFGITNVIGQVMFEEVKTLSKGLHTIEVDASSYSQGVYILSFKNNDRGLNFERKFVKQ